MKKLSYLSGTWSGEVRMLRGGDFVTLQQLEDVQYKLGGLALMIEGTGRTLSDQTIVAQALGIISYDDETEAYRIRAWVDGRMLESEVKLLDDGKGLRWGFGVGEIRSHSELKVDENGVWTETAEVVIGSQPARKLMDLTVRHT